MNTETINTEAAAPEQQQAPDPRENPNMPFNGESAFTALLMKNEQQQQPNDSQLETTDSEEQPEVLEGVEDEETEAPEDSEEQPESAEDDSEGEEQPEYVLAEDDHVVEIDGESLSIRELKDGYLRQSDYTKKTQELKAETTKIARSEVIQEVGEHLAVASSETVEMLKKFQGMDWAKLAKDNPADYAKYRQRFDALQARSQKQYAALKDLEAKNAEAQKEEMRSKANKSFKVLTDTIPNFDKPLFTEILKHAQSLGCTPDELNMIHDHRSITALYESMLYRQGKAKTTKKSKGVKKTIQKRAGAAQETKPKDTRPVDRYGRFDGKTAFLNKLTK